MYYIEGTTRPREKFLGLKFGVCHELDFELGLEM